VAWASTGLPMQALSKYLLLEWRAKHVFTIGRHGRVSSPVH
jgi:hypothetical protein